jgi:hypothetical protein
MRRDSWTHRQGWQQVMTSQIKQDLDKLRAKYDQWEIWVVYRVYGGPVYCARPRDDHRQVLNAGSPIELEDAIHEAEGEH